MVWYPLRNYYYIKRIHIFGDLSLISYYDIIIIIIIILISSQ